MSKPKKMKTIALLLELETDLTVAEIRVALRQMRTQSLVMESGQFSQSDRARIRFDALRQFHVAVQQAPKAKAAKKGDGK